MSVSAVTLGNFFTTSDGKTVLGGSGGSGLDTQTLVKGLVTAKSLPITQDQTHITTNNSQITALTTFNTLLTNFQSASDALRNPPGVNNDASNVFAFTTGSVGNGGSAYVSVSPTAGASLQSYNISGITSVASAATQTSGVFSLASVNADATTSAATYTNGDIAFAPGTITFANSATVTVRAGDSLNNIAANFNAASGQTGITASIIQVDGTHFKLSFAATATGTTANFDLSNVSTITGGSAVLAGLNFNSVPAGTVAVAGSNAAFKINGVPISRQTNTISDVVSNVTFTILQNTPDGTTNYPVTIRPDTTTVQNTIVRFTTAYNALQSFAAQQTQQNSDGTFATTAILANNQTFRQTMSEITGQILVPGAGLSGTLKGLSDLGISLTNQAATDTLPAVNNILNVDDTKLTSLLASNFSGVKNVFGFNLSSDNANLAVFKSSKPLNVQDFTVTISNSAFTASYTQNGNAVTIPLTATAIGNDLGFSLTAPDGSALEGLQLIYGSTDNATIHVTTSQGVADKMYNVGVVATTTKTGSVAVAVSGIQTATTTLNSDISRLTTQVNQYQNQLLAKFAALESAVSKVNTLLQSLNANSNAQMSSSGH